MKKDFLKLQDYSPEEILGLIDLGIELKRKLKKGIPHPFLQGKTLGMIFAKASTRTRVSFEAGMGQLGGKTIYMNTSDMQLGRGESIADTARTLSRYVDLIMIRTFSQQDVADLAFYADVPVINGLTDYCHPTQALADLMTIKEYKGGFKGVKLCYTGDGNNVANSLIVGGLKAGLTVSVACPQGYEPDAKILKWAKKNGTLTLHNNVFDAAKGADVVYTDVWASMGQEKEAEKRREIFKPFQVNNEVLKVCQKGVIVQHCLPAHKNEEIAFDTFETHAKEIFDEAENRMHIHKAIMCHVMENSGF
jgi:ornithine carbamoyltransferase